MSGLVEILDSAARDDLHHGLALLSGMVTDYGQWEGHPGATHLCHLRGSIAISSPKTDVFNHILPLF